jgi:hypothetical protein
MRLFRAICLESYSLKARCQRLGTGTQLIG